MNTKMKVLSLALVGLCGFAGSAMAACPAGPAIADGGAWTSKAQLSGGTVTVVTGGLDGSECRLDAAIAGSFASVATVLDDSPANEPHYRFQYLLNPDAFGTFGAADGAIVFSANATTAFPATGGRTPLVQIALAPGAAGAKRLVITASCNNSATNYKCSTQTTDLPAGVNRIEVELVVGAGATGTLNYWLNAAQGTNAPTATGSIASLDNTGWVGVDKAVLGLAGPTPSFKNNHAGQALGLDTFDSRRSTYIGW